MTVAWVTCLLTFASTGLVARVEASKPNDTCGSEAPCYNGLSCNDHNLCQCPLHTPRWHAPSMLCEGVYFGEPCNVDIDCRDDARLYCLNKSCECHGWAPVWNVEDRECVEKRLGDSCDEDADEDGGCIDSTECVNGECQCAYGTPLPDLIDKSCSSKIKFRKACPPGNIYGSCDHNALTCRDSVCACQMVDSSGKSLEFFEKFRYSLPACRSRAKRLLNETCGEEDRCNSERGLHCDGKKCKCSNDRTWIQNLCQLAPKNCGKDSECDATRGMSCNVARGECVCPIGQELSSVSGTCKLKAYSACVEHGVPRHDRCSSGICLGADTNPSAVAARCSCGATDGVKRIWSAVPNQGCIPDYFGLPCHPNNNNRDCSYGPEWFDSLECSEMNGGWFCACPEDRTYLQGFCALAIRTHGQECDPKGVEPTCTVDLVCDVGALGDFKCRCHHKAVTLANGSIAYYPMTVHPGSTVCESSATSRLRVLQQLQILVVIAIIAPLLNK